MCIIWLPGEDHTSYFYTLSNLRVTYSCNYNKDVLVPMNILLHLYACEHAHLKFTSNCYVNSYYILKERSLITYIFVWLSGFVHKGRSNFDVYFHFEIQIFNMRIQ